MTNLSYLILIKRFVKLCVTNEETSDQDDF